MPRARRIRLLALIAAPDDPAARAIEEVAARLAALPRSLGGRRLDVSVR